MYFVGDAGRRRHELDALVDHELDDVRVAHERLGDVHAERLVGEVAHLADLVLDRVELARRRLDDPARAGAATPPTPAGCGRSSPSAPARSGCRRRGRGDPVVEGGVVGVHRPIVDGAVSRRRRAGTARIRERLTLDERALLERRRVQPRAEREHRVVAEPSEADRTAAGGQRVSRGVVHRAEVERDHVTRFHVPRQDGVPIDVSVELGIEVGDQLVTFDTFGVRRVVDELLRGTNQRFHRCEPAMNRTPLKPALDRARSTCSRSGRRRRSSRAGRGATACARWCPAPSPVCARGRTGRWSSPSAASPRRRGRSRTRPVGRRGRPAT